MTTARRGRAPRRAGTGAAVAAGLLVGLVGCGAPAAAPRTPTTPSAAVSAPASTPSATPSATQAEVGKLLVVVAENRSAATVAQGMPFVTSLGQTYGSAGHYYGVTHPSLPNYLTIAGGSTFGVRNDLDPSQHTLHGSSVFGQLLAAGRTTKTYAEAMPGTCALRNSGRYAVRHNPWTYFADPAERAACRSLDVPAGTPTEGALADDLATGGLPDFSLLIPDDCHNGHDCPSSVTDRWLRSWMTAVQKSPDFTSGRLTVVLTWDEDDDHSDNRVALVVVHPALAGKTVGTRLDHHALSATISRLAGAQPLRDARDAPDLLRSFGLRP